MRILVVILGVVVLSAAFYRAEVGGSGSTTITTAPREPQRPKLPAVQNPKPPAAYRIPKAAARVSSSARLAAALAKRRRGDIALLPGVYHNPGPFLNPHGHRIYAARPGRAILRAGISIGANSGGKGALLRGLVFDVRDQAKTLNGAIIAVWGSAANVRVLDTTLRGNHVAAAGIVSRQPEGFVARRIVARDFTDYGVLVDANELDRKVLTRRFLLEDLDIANVSRPERRSSKGTAEACLWIGNTGTVRRVKVRNCAWMGVWTGTATTRALVEDIDIDWTPTGIYIEHFTQNSMFQRIRVRSHVRIGIVAEWADPDWGGRPASIDNVIQSSMLESRTCGAFLDEGTTRTIIRRSWFRRQTWAAIADYRGNANEFYDNDYSGIGRTAVPISHDRVDAAPR